MKASGLKYYQEKIVRNSNPIPPLPQLPFEK